MASILRVNTLTDASSNNSTAMSTINKGTVKAWVNLNGTGTVAINSSFNTSGITDEGTGHYSHSFTNNFADAHYVGSGSAMFSTSTNLHTITIGDNDGAAGTVPTSSSYELRTPYIAIASVALQDCTRITVGNVGDLA
jgi:hypothetical protein